MEIKRKYPIGAEFSPHGVSFRVWAPNHQKVQLLFPDPKMGSIIMDKEENGYFSLFVPGLKANTHYFFQLDDEQKKLADPASRYQPQGPSGPSCIINSNYSWEDQLWQGISMEGQIIYEMHIGTFTEQGSYFAAADKLEDLLNLGITVLEIMPVNEFSGQFGWGYDGVNLFAPFHGYGSPDDLKYFINKAHRLGLAVILDVVYNHFGPEGNSLPLYSPQYLVANMVTDWGAAINFDNVSAREFFLTNVRYWIEEFHFDGLRVDASSNLHSKTPVHILRDIVITARAAAGTRKIIIIAENEPQNSQLLYAENTSDDYYDGLVNDDFHHTAVVRLTGKRDAYLTDYLGTPQEFISAVKYGFLYQGQYYSWQKQNRGLLNFEIPPKAMVIYLESHDQIANSLDGRRLIKLSDPGVYRALTCLLLLGPNTPMLFQGQEYGSTKPFYYFVDHSVELNKLVKKGRKKFLFQFLRIASQEHGKKLVEISTDSIFSNSKLNHQDKNVQCYNLHRDLIYLRKNDRTFQKMAQLKIDGAVLGNDAFLIRYFSDDNHDRLLLFNFGVDYNFDPCPEPLLTPGKGNKWEVLWSSESPNYAGGGTPAFSFKKWNILGHSALVLGTVQIKERIDDSYK